MLSNQKRKIKVFDLKTYIEFELKVNVNSRFNDTIKLVHTQSILEAIKGWALEIQGLTFEEIARKGLIVRDEWMKEIEVYDYCD